jgi:hypothetical protein
MPSSRPNALAPRFTPDRGQSFSALDLHCPGCQAEIGQRCTRARICPDRLQAARDAIASGKLKARGPAVTELAECGDCGMTRKNARPLPCRESHRCQKTISGYRCVYAVTPGSDLCEHHRTFSTALQTARKPGRKPTLNQQQEADIVRRYRAGASPILRSRLNSA